MSVLVEVEWLDVIRFSGWSHPEANVFRWLKLGLHETGIITPTAYWKEGRPWTPVTPANEDSLTAAVTRALENPTRWAITRELERSQLTVLEFASLRLLVDRTSVQKVRPLRMKFCSDIKRRNSLYITEEVRKVVCASGVVNVHNRPRPLCGCGNPHVSVTVFSRRIKNLIWADCG
jgi:hypothetical protein